MHKSLLVGYVPFMRYCAWKKRRKISNAVARNLNIGSIVCLCFTSCMIVFYYYTVRLPLRDLFIMTCSCFLSFSFSYIYKRKKVQ